MTENTKPIGVFDSGLGGLTVVKTMLEQMPQENIIYFGDTARVPYGGRSRETIIEYACEDVAFLRQYDVKAVVIACNTADSMARTVIESRYSLPIIGVVEPAAKKAAAVTKNGRIGVIGTRATVSSGAYESAVKKHNPQAEVFSQACPLLVPLVENGRFHAGDRVAELLVEEYLQPLRDKRIDTLVLGCTHYPLLLDIFMEQLPDIPVICSGTESTHALYGELSARGLCNSSQTPGSRQYFVSDDAAGFSVNAQAFIGGNSTVSATLIHLPCMSKPT